MASQRAPKQWSLTKVEDVNSFESWKENLKYTLSLDANFAPFLVSGFKWNKDSKADPNRGLTNDPPGDANSKTAQQKVVQLNMMLGQIANYCPVITRNTIVKKSTSIDSIWQSIRSHFGFQSSGGHFLDLADMKLESGERPEDLYQRLMAFVEDNLLTTSCGIKHNNEDVTDDEELTPTVENVIVLLWLKLTHPELPRLVKQRYGTELRSRTLASIKPEISQALSSLLDELHTNEEARVMRFSGRGRRSSNQYKRDKDSARKPSRPECCLCKQAGRRDISHFLSTCSFLPEKERKFLTRARLIETVDDSEISPDDDSEESEADTDRSTKCRSIDTYDQRQPIAASRKVQIKKSPFLKVFYNDIPVKVTLDTGAETDMIREDVAHSLQARITKSRHLATQADGRSPLHICGETRLTLVRGKHTFELEALVVKELDADILAGVPFLDMNDITVRTSRRQVILRDNTVIEYNHSSKSSDTHAFSQATSHVLRVSKTTTIWPDEFLELETPSIFDPDSSVALEPRYDMSGAQADIWFPPFMTSAVEGKVRIQNLTNSPVVLKRNEHIAQVLHAYEPDELSYKPQVHPFSKQTKKKSVSFGPVTIMPVFTRALYSDNIPINPDNILPSDIVNRLKDIHKQYDRVFDPSYPGYNGSVGPIQGIVNIGPVQPPQRKRRLPQYSRNKLVELQEKFDELEATGVFVKPDQANVVVEYLNPSFLVKKGSKGFRLVTAFNEVGSYAKPQPSLMPDVDSTLRKLASWKYLVKTDLTSAFYQIPLQKESMKYCGVVTPYRGVRVYARCAMGMPGSETALEELMSRVLGDLLQEGIVVKIADDLYCGGDTPLQPALNWERLLHALDKANLRLSASKTLVGPKSAIVLGWIWCQGTIKAGSHRITALSTCSAPSTVKGLRSFIGAVKVLARVIPKCSYYLSPLEDIVAGRQSGDHIIWSEEMLTSFENAKKCLNSNKTITLPRPTDTLWIVTDGAVKDYGLGATLYVTRSDINKPKLSGYFSAKLRKRQVGWMPCELEALSIASAINHFSPYIIQSDKQAHVVTDSKPCVEAYQKLNRGEFSSSSRVTTFMTAVSRYQVSVRHLSGKANTPSDFTCRNAVPCTEPFCQICSFIAELEDSVVRQLTVQDLVSGTAKVPFFSRSAWRESQNEDSDLRRTHAHLTQGTRPSKKATNIRDVKRYLQVATIARDGLLVVRKEEPFKAPRECIIIPRNAFPGLITALHIKLSHPSAYQLKQVVRRTFYALDLDKQIDELNEHCHICASLKSFPAVNTEQSTGDEPKSVGSSFAADVIRQTKQCILVVRECVTSFTAAKIIPDEQHTSLRSGLIELCLPMRSYEGPCAMIRVDPAPGFQALINDEQLKLSLDIRRKKNPNKNPIAEKAVQEVEIELLKQNPSGGPVSEIQLAIAINCLNSRIRNRGLSAYEMWTQRDQFLNNQIDVSDKELILSQQEERNMNHIPSAKSKAPLRKPRSKAKISAGDLVYLYRDRSKLKARDRYMVLSVDKNFCNLRKFTENQFRSPIYSVKLDECYLVPSEFNATSMSNLKRYRDSDMDSDNDETDYEQVCFPPSVLQPPVSHTPDIPVEITEPPVEVSENTDTVCHENIEPTEESSTELQVPRRSTRERKPPPRFADYVIEGRKRPTPL